MSKNIAIIGSGFSSLSAACYLAQKGHQVCIFEKNKNTGGRASQLKKDGFTFDMGPSWYWMPDVFEKFFKDFNHKVSDFYTLEKLNPAYKVVFSNSEISIEDTPEKIINTFESIEKGSGKALRNFLKEAEDNYNIAIKDLVYNPGVSPLELITPQTAIRVGQFFSTITKKVQKKVKDPRLRSILEFPVLFLGAKPCDTPAFYSFMNHADFSLGTWQPKGGMYSVVSAMTSLAKSLGVAFRCNTPIKKIRVDDTGKVLGITTNTDENINFDTVLSGADYHHSEQLLDIQWRQYSEKYWLKKTFAPSSLLYYVGFNTKLQNITHHNLFFDTDFEKHAEEIYDKPQWPTQPLFYANFTSVTDPNTAPEGCENAFFLVPVAPGLKDTKEIQDKYFKRILKRLEKHTGQDLEKHIIFKENFGVSDFTQRYNSYKGNAYGMANTLLQTAFLRPKLKSKKVKNLFFTGQLTVPGPGVPPSIISGKLVADLIDAS